MNITRWFPHVSENVIGDYLLAKYLHHADSASSYKVPEGYRRHFFKSARKIPLPGESWFTFAPRDLRGSKSIQFSRNPLSRYIRFTEDEIVAATKEAAISGSTPWVDMRNIVLKELSYDSLYHLVKHFGCACPLCRKLHFPQQCVSEIIWRRNPLFFASNCLRGIGMEAHTKYNHKDKTQFAFFFDICPECVPIVERAYWRSNIDPSMVGPQVEITFLAELIPRLKRKQLSRLWIVGK